MSINSRRPRQSRIMSSADVTRAANALIADASHCPGCNMVAPWVGGKHGQTCKTLRAIVRDADRIASHRNTRAL